MRRSRIVSNYALTRRIIALLLVAVLYLILGLVFRPSALVPTPVESHDAGTIQAELGASGSDWYFTELDLRERPQPPPPTLSPAAVSRRSSYWCHLRHEGVEREEGWRQLEPVELPYTCENYAVLKCPKLPGEEPPPIPKGRALVLYMLHSTVGTELGKMPEWDNVEIMLAQGVIPAGQSTELFDGVDYVFYRIATHLQKIELCAQEENIRFLWVPPGPCDLCEHARVLQYLGYSADQNLKPWPYRSIVMMNSGVRGPFVHPDGADWIDVVSMAGQPSRPRYGADDDAGFRTVASPLMSWEYNPHPQSYFLVLTNAALFRIFSTLLHTCTDPTKTVCIFSGELILGDLLLDAGFSVHLFGFNATLTDRAFGERLRHLYSIETALNPTLGYHHPCKGIFIKFGGDIWKKKLVSEKTIQAIRRFGLHLSLSGRRYGVGFEFLETQQCDILQ